MTHPHTLRYNFRYFLPYPPEWGDAAFCRRRLDELLRFCAAGAIDAVQFFVNIRSDGHYMPPATAAEQKLWAEWMRDTAAPAIRAAGMSYQLNFMLIFGANTGGGDLRQRYDWRFMVDQHGRESRGCPCPDDPIFRERMGAMLQLWAATRPEVLWIDDDFRLHHHGNGNGEMDFYCFCPAHLEKFSRRIGRTIDRNTLVQALLAPGRPDPLRGEWLDFCGATMNELARWIREQVTAVSPDTRLALMTSVPEVHSAEGRDWKTLLTRLDDRHRPCTRPSCGFYFGNNDVPAAQAATYTLMAQSIDILRQEFGEGNFEAVPEVENTRFTTWSKSLRNTKFQMTLAPLLGAREITLSISDLEGNALTEEPENLALLRGSRRFLNALAALECGRWRREGILFPNLPTAARSVRLEPGTTRMDALGKLSTGWNYWLNLGVPGWFGAPEEAGDAVVVLDAYTAAALSTAALRKILAGKVLIDGGAAAVLSGRGMYEALGLSARRRTDGENLGYEQFIAVPEAGFIGGRFQHQSDQWSEFTLAGARRLSEVVSWSGAHFPGMTVFVNAAGGRVAAVAGDIRCQKWAHSHGRMRQLHALLRWLDPDFPVLPIVPHPVLTLKFRRDDVHLLALANLGYDPLRRLSFYGGCEAAQREYLGDDGCWRSLPESAPGAAWTLAEPREVFDFLVVRWKEAQR